MTPDPDVQRRRAALAEPARVLIVEALAQAAGVLAVESLGLAGSGKLVYFMAIEGAKFRKPVVPGDTVRFHMTKLRSRRNMWWYRGEARVDDHLVAEAEVGAMLAS